MEKQIDLFHKNEKDRLSDLYSTSMKEYKKIIGYFGNLKASIMCIGLAPQINHLKSNSNSIFAFDINLNQTTHSGGVICRVFKELDLKIEDYFWSNLYKIPVEDVVDKEVFKDMIKGEINIIFPSVIVCLGSEVYNIISKLNLPFSIDIKKIHHPAYFLRGGISFNKYVEQWRKI